MTPFLQPTHALSHAKCPLNTTCAATSSPHSARPFSRGRGAARGPMAPAGEVVKGEAAALADSSVEGAARARCPDHDGSSLRPSHGRRILRDIAQVLPLLMQSRARCPDHDGSSLRPSHGRRILRDIAQVLPLLMQSRARCPNHDGSSLRPSHGRRILRDIAQVLPLLMQSRTPTDACRWKREAPVFMLPNPRAKDARSPPRHFAITNSVGAPHGQWQGWAEA